MIGAQLMFAAFASSGSNSRQLLVATIEDFRCDASEVRGRAKNQTR